MTTPIVLVEIDAYDPDLGAVKTLRFCDGLAYRTLPTETPPNALYRPMIADTGWTRVDLYTAPGAYGRVTPGEVKLLDLDGVLGTELIGYAFDGRAITIRIGSRGAAYPAGYTTVLSGALDGPPSFDWGSIAFRPADRAAAMAQPFSSPRFAGTNVLPLGIEGIDDLKGRVKPIVLALAQNMTPACVNTSKLIYLVSAPLAALTATVAVSAVRDMGVPVTAGAAYASMAALLDDAQKPAAGQFKVLATAAAGCYVRLGSSPIGAVTCDAAYGTAADRTHAQVWKRILLCMGVAAGDISAADVAVLDTALPGEIALLIDAETTADQLLTEIADSAGAAWYGDDAGLWRITQWLAPAGAPVATLTELRTMNMDIADPVGTGDVAPAYRVTLAYGRNHTPQADADLGGDKTSPADTVRAPGGRAALAARAWLAAESSIVQAEDLAIKTPHPNAIELQLTSLLVDAAAAQAFCDARFALYSVARHMTTITQRLDAEQIATVRVGAVVSVQGGRWGYAGGRLMRVAGALIDQARRLAQLTVWG